MWQGTICEKKHPEILRLCKDGHTYVKTRQKKGQVSSNSRLDMWISLVSPMRAFEKLLSHPHPSVASLSLCHIEYIIYMPCILFHQVTVSSCVSSAARPGAGSRLLVERRRSVGVADVPVDLRAAPEASQASTSPVSLVESSLLSRKIMQKLVSL